MTRTDDGAALDIADLVRYIAKGLVDKPDEVHVALVEERQASVYELEVAESDLGKIIGRGGKTARALRTLVTQVAPRSKKISHSACAREPARLTERSFARKPSATV